MATAGPPSPRSFDELLEARRKKELARSVRERATQQEVPDSAGMRSDVLSPQSTEPVTSPSMALVHDMNRVTDAGLFTDSPKAYVPRASSYAGPRSPPLSTSVPSYLGNLPPAPPAASTITEQGQMSQSAAAAQGAVPVGNLPQSPVLAHSTGASPIYAASPTASGPMSPTSPSLPPATNPPPSNSSGQDTRYSQMTASYDKEKYELRQAQLLAEIKRLQEVLDAEANLRRTAEKTNEELRRQLIALHEVPQITSLDWKHLPGRDKADKLVQQNTALRDMVLKKLCYQCGQPMNCGPCTPYPVCGLELSEGHNYGIEGVCVISVKDGGPADQAGITPGDIITKFCDQPVPTRPQFKTLLHTCSPLQPANFELYRDNGPPKDPFSVRTKAESKKRWVHMAGRLILGSSEQYPTSHRTIFHVMDPTQSSPNAPLGGSPRAARERGDQRATSPPPFKTSPRGNVVSPPRGRQ